MSLFGDMSSYIGPKLFFNFFGVDSTGSSLVFVAIMYAMVFGVGLKMKLSLDAMMVAIGLTTAIAGGFLAQAIPIMGIFMIIAGIVASLGFALLWRR